MSSAATASLGTRRSFAPRNTSARSFIATYSSRREAAWLSLSAAEHEIVMRHGVIAGMHHLVVHGERVDIVEVLLQEVPEVALVLAVHMTDLAVLRSIG